MPQPEPRLLVIDDNPAIAADISRILKPQGDALASLHAAEAAVFGAAQPLTAVPSWEVDTATQGQEGVAMAAAACQQGNAYAVAFVDMRMPPGWDGLETVQQLWRVDPCVQVVICSAYSDYSWGDLRARLGATDNLLILKKPFDTIEVQQLAASLTRKWQLARHARAKFSEMEKAVEDRTAELRHSEERFSVAFKAAPFAQAIICFATGRVVDANEAFTALLGFRRNELLDHSSAFLSHTGLMASLQKPHPLMGDEATLTARDGTPRHVQLSTQPTTISGGPHLILMAEDITTRKHLESQLMHSQKMEAVGQLAAGVAHDFNNILTVIQGHISLQLATNDFTDDTRAALSETLAAGERAASLTRQLLTFSRRQLFQPEPLDLNALIATDAAMLQRLIGEQIEVKWECQEGLAPVMGDAPGISQAVMNLVINARDAMPRGGQLRIATGTIGISASRAAQNPEARPGQFVRFSVTDTGKGMDEATRRRIFEPFFTTKEVGEGSGLGLASVYGIVKQHEGWIEVFSDPGQGTSFFIYLPVAAEMPVTSPKALDLATPIKLNVLLVEDEPAVRSIMRQVLKHCGCQVIEACDARDGYEKWTANKDSIDLLVTDIVMPGGATGHDLARQLLDERPDLKVIYSSGYSADLFVQGSELIPGRNFLPKPYDAASVVTLIRRVASEKQESLGTNFQR